MYVADIRAKVGVVQAEVSRGELEGQLGELEDGRRRRDGFAQEKGTSFRQNDVPYLIGTHAEAQRQEGRTEAQQVHDIQLMYQVHI